MNEKDSFYLSEEINTKYDGETREERKLRKEDSLSKSEQNIRKYQKRNNQGTLPPEAVMTGESLYYNNHLKIRRMMERNRK